ncbi:hypothetical protein PV349_12535 [Streptomyces sp. WI04-05A]|uniref:hypothetical protein n=1 Tax=Streptomyces TaxID=1883 RepID=UPI0029A18152|nr:MULTISPECIES: hypothetical protein [unclassified Streptomyces]MDX2584219.1 hypothetical protein [Streptomyces sp. WI04-05A]
MAWIVAIVLFVEAFGIAALNWFLGIVVGNQQMSLAGLDPDMMSMSSKIGGLVFGAYFALCGVVALLVALRDRSPAGLGRVLLISVAVVHALLGAFAWGLVGVPAFLTMVVVLALVVLLLMTYDRQNDAAAMAPEDGTDGSDGTGGTGGGSPAVGNGGSPLTPPPTPSTP